ncbi:hypothetical protein MPL3356_340185 [Mesorhizobium plurifarium]|uniref:Transposase IS116/IS110/IS902 C-terminal domain-containing protein n=1 Tax=Mesorhizobium plurifarium TaxID=69974 RepID=A0A090E1Z0_MESPL|nr:hypothetical protein MPL3356_340185 [Mesorhizobium plurifarium]
MAQWIGKLGFELEPLAEYALICIKQGGSLPMRPRCQLWRRDRARPRRAPLPLVQLTEFDDEIRQSDHAILALANTDEMARRLMTVPGIGPITASALAASIQDISAFSAPRIRRLLGVPPR